MEVGVRPQGHELGLRKPEMEMRGGSRRPGGHEGGGDRQVGTPECPIGNLQSPPLTLLGASSVRHKVLETGDRWRKGSGQTERGSEDGGGIMEHSDGGKGVRKPLHVSRVHLGRIHM